jgi:hypothetical protein
MHPDHVHMATCAARVLIACAVAAAADRLHTRLDHVHTGKCAEPVQIDDAVAAAVLQHTGPGHVRMAKAWVAYAQAGAAVAAAVPYTGHHRMHMEMSVVCAQVDDVVAVVAAAVACVAAAVAGAVARASCDLDRNSRFLCRCAACTSGGMSDKDTYTYTHLCMTDIVRASGHLFSLIKVITFAGGKKSRGSPAQ